MFTHVHRAEKTNVTPKWYNRNHKKAEKNVIWKRFPQHLSSFRLLLHNTSLVFLYLFLLLKSTHFIWCTSVRFSKKYHRLLSRVTYHNRIWSDIQIGSNKGGYKAANGNNGSCLFDIFTETVLVKNIDKYKHDCLFIYCIPLPLILGMVKQTAAERTSERLSLQTCTNEMVNNFCNFTCFVRTPSRSPHDWRNRSPPAIVFVLTIKAKWMNSKVFIVVFELSK